MFVLCVAAFGCDVPIGADIVEPELRGTAYAAQGLVTGTVSSTGSLLVGLIAGRRCIGVVRCVREASCMLGVADQIFDYRKRETDIKELPKSGESRIISFCHSWG